MNFLERAEILVQLGFPVVPVLPKTKRCILDGWGDRATTDMGVLEQWNRENPNSNTGAVGKKAVGLIFDIDAPEIFEQLKADGIDLGALRTFKVRGGKTEPGCGHYYFLQTEASRALGNCDRAIWSRETGKKVATQFDVKSNNAYCVGPGSVHPSGAIYTVIDSSPPIPIPGELVAWLAAHKGVVWIGEAPAEETTRGEARRRRPGSLESRVEEILERCAGKQYTEIKSVLAEYDYAHRHEFDAALAQYLLLKFKGDREKARGEFARLKLHQDKPSVYDETTLDAAVEWHSGQNVEFVREEKTIKPVLLNAIAALKTQPWAGVLGFNEFSLHVEALKAPPFLRSERGRNWVDHDDSLTCAWLQRNGIFVNTSIAGEAVQTVAKMSRFHPIRDYLNSVAWDGEPRLFCWLSKHLGGADNAWTRAIGPRWMIAACARIFEPGCQCDYLLLLEGPQGVKKSKALRTLAGRDEWFTDHGSELGTKDARLELSSKWIVEFGELAGMRRGDLDKIKQFITTRVDAFRLPYGHRVENFPRSNVFAGTCNGDSPLSDETGGRRFWPMTCGEINVEALERDRDLLWAEAVDRYRAGDAWWLETAELNALAVEEQEARYAQGVWDARILDWIEDPQQAEERVGEHGVFLPVTPFESQPGRVTVADVLLHCIRKPVERQSQADQNAVQRCLVHAGWKKRRLRIRSDEPGPGRLRWFYVASPEYLQEHGWEELF